MGDRPEDDKKNEQGSVKDKFSESLENLKKNEKIEELYKYAKSNTGDTIAYVAMILGILILFFEPFYGGLLIGFIAGLYFSDEIAKPLRSIEESIEELGMVRSLVFGGLLLGLFIEVPMIFIGLALAVGLKQLIFPGNGSKEKTDTK